MVWVTLSCRAVMQCAALTCGRLPEPGRRSRAEPRRGPPRELIPPAACERTQAM